MTRMCVWKKTGRFDKLIFQFLLFNKDVKNISIWMDNCVAQNKNWCLLTFLIYVINSKEIETTEINLFYFEPGHSFMSADSFHHKVRIFGFQS